MDKKKVLSIVLGSVGVIALIVGIIFVVKLARTPMVSVISERVKYGEEGYLTLKARNFKKDVSAFDITLEFDKNDIEVLGIDKGTMENDVVTSKELYANNEGKIVVLSLDYTGGDNPLDINNDICYVRFKLKRPVRTKISVGKVNVVDPDGTILDGVLKKGVKVGR